MGNGKVATTNQPVLVRKWKVFPGKNRFCCDGRCICAPNIYGLVIAYLSLAVVGSLYFIFDAPYIAVRLTPVIPVIVFCLSTFIFWTLCRTSCSDPGILPRSESPEEEAVGIGYCTQRLPMNGEQYESPINQDPNHPDADNLSFSSSPCTGKETDCMMKYSPGREDDEYSLKGWAGNNDMHGKSSTDNHQVEVLVNGTLLKLEYCIICQIVKPPRTTHCHDCDNCVERYDHHCLLVGNCIGKRNYRMFYSFVIAMATASFLIGCCNIAVVVLRTIDTSFEEALLASIPSLIEGFMCFGGFCLGLGFGVYHTYLVSKNLTIREYNDRHATAEDERLPLDFYSKGSACSNFLSVLCSSLTPSLIDRRGFTTVKREENTGNRNTDCMALV